MVGYYQPTHKYVIVAMPAVELINRLAIKRITTILERFRINRPRWMPTVVCTNIDMIKAYAA
jgi:hypothetical protein